MPELAVDQFQGCSARAAGVPVIPLMRGRGWVAQPPTEVARDEAVQNAFYLVILIAAAIPVADVLSGLIFF